MAEARRQTTAPERETSVDLPGVVGQVMAFGEVIIVEAPRLAILEIAQQEHGIGQIAGVERRVHLHADESLMSADHQCGDTVLPKITE